MENTQVFKDDVIFEEVTKIGRHNQLTVQVEKTFWNTFAIVAFDEIYDIWEEIEENDETAAKQTAEKVRIRLVNELNGNA